MKQRAWTHLQLLLALWLIPVGPVAIAFGIGHAIGWPSWMLAILVLTITWPVAWYIWLMGEDNAIRR